MKNLLKQRYWIIGYDDHYPCGFANDVIDTTNILKKAKKILKTNTYQNRYIFDVDKRKIIWRELGNLYKL